MRCLGHSVACRDCIRWSVGFPGRYQDRMLGFYCMTNPLVRFGATSLVARVHFAAPSGFVGSIETSSFVHTHFHPAYREALVAAGRCSG